MKVSIIGAGNVGATLAQRILESGLAEVVLLDVLREMAKGKAYDMQDAAAILGSDIKIKGTSDYKDIEDSNIVVITAGKARRPGMSRDDLQRENAVIVKDVAGQIKKYAKDSIVIVVTNPLDVMAYLVHKVTGFPSTKVFGMAGVLDAGRLSCILSQHLNTQPKNIKSLVLGTHGDSMVPVFKETFVNGKALDNLLPENDLPGIQEKVQNRGGEIVSLLGTGSAYYGPSAATFLMIKSILNDEKKTFAVSALLQGEYGLKDVYIGVPVKLGKQGIEEVLEIKLDKQCTKALGDCASIIKQSISKLQI